MDEVQIPWERFSSDPRAERNAGLRSSDLDRSLALDALASAYGDGRLDREEYDERAGAVQGSKTLGELVPPLRDLAPEQPSKAVGLSSDAALTEQATERYYRARGGALGTFMAPSLVCWVIWAISGFGFPWPVFVMFSVIPLLKLMLDKRGYIAEEKRRLARREQRRIEQRPR
ncbi:DUF1707 domain-containing protein [Nocardioides mangrovicus]|uniref:DUF1707 domain-containing protein n=1 Tax=Nocardioides mangrovicus TaxID=2478913 RepID=A0A3L8P3T4_9ACTN|nr:DUF1707 domain-containing protein [Nocardioides mangrovicus]RLV50050.1 DUF1707 domain-containing protein [Nocardioides mangrovicus]